jgi:hypothetical protein
MKSAKDAVALSERSVIGFSFLKKKKIRCGSAFAKKVLRPAFNGKPKKISPLRGLFRGLPLPTGLLLNLN